MTVPMKLVTILQLLGVFVMYFGLTVCLPALIFHKKLQGERFAVRFLACFLMGNFYIINLVLVLQLLHISNRFTLLLFTLVPAAWAGIRINQLDVRACVLGVLEFVRRILEGTLGLRLIVSNAGRRLADGVGKRIYRKGRDSWREVADRLMAVLAVILVLGMFGTNALNTYGYCFSDIPVHNYWIEEMCGNHIFAAGVYPFGFHCVIYYLHQMFGVETYVLLRLFCLAQTLMVHLVLLAFLRIVCRSRFMPYLALILYTFGDYWNRDVVEQRYLASLPQEFGMIFILPAAAFLILFFSARGKEGGKRGLRVQSTRYLIWFAMSFSMTLAIHFYNTMIIGLFCIGIAGGHLGLVFRRAYFGRIMLAGVMSILIAVLPMGAAYATGIPLQGSLGWGLDIIRGSSGEQMQIPEGAGTGTEAEAEGSPPPGAVGTEGPAGGESDAVQGDTQLAEEKSPGLLAETLDTVNSFILSQISRREVGLWLLLVPLLALFGGVNLITKTDRAYGCVLISVSVFLVFMLVMLMAPQIGIPALMDTGRSSIYLAYGLAMAAALCADAAVSSLLGRLANPAVMQSVSLAGVALMAIGIAVSGKSKKPLIIPGLETNGAIICLTNILREEPYDAFTICSANDENHMVEEYGFHYEMITLLYSMEGKFCADYLTIPTPRVYFFIEKIPGDYDKTKAYEGSGRTVSEEGASHTLPGGSGIEMYTGESRYIVMSRMYYWAKAFQKLYPNEMKVYYETDDFVCYVLNQNPYRLFDLSIDYGYNIY